ncbi:peptidase [Kitasatospora sp. LaBMicrA B282]|uniref:peptidase n=1 Tax=Kitasatospora sp. LaBMicrA B282 TaxID=3420949 RepID=UPI003D10BDE2
MRLIRILTAAPLALGLATLLAPAAAADAPSPTASASAGAAAPTTTDFGTSFLTATTLAPGQDAAVTAATGDYLYWSFAASEGQTATVQVTVALPPAADRHGSQTWSLDLYDGLRRLQACTAGPQDATGDQTTGSLTMSCTLRQVRSWAEPWSDDPLPGTYYARVSTPDVQQQDLGLATQVSVHVATKGGADDAQPEGGSLREPLVPPVNAGAVAAPGGAAVPTPAASPSATPQPGTLRAAAPVKAVTHWYSTMFSGWNTRWYWTLCGGGLAALAGVVGYRFTRHPRGARFFRPAPVPHQGPAPAARQETYRS